MITMRHGLMAAAWAVHMISWVRVTLMGWCTARRVNIVHRQAVLVDMIAVHMMQMSVMQVVNVAIVLDCCMATARLMLMAVIWMLRASTHVKRLLRLLGNDCRLDNQG